MAQHQLAQLLVQLRTQGPSLPYSTALALLSKAKLHLLQLDALTPSTIGDPTLLALARTTYEQGALASIRARDPDAFTRYVAQLAAFYALPDPDQDSDMTEQNKVTGLYLLLLLTQGRYGEFHSELEALVTRRSGGGSAGDVEHDDFLGYPIRLERWLMEGSYDRVWRAIKQAEVPCDEYGVFSEILTSQIRAEIASSSERAYPFLPISFTKSLLFLDSEGAVLDFAHSRNWTVKDGYIIFSHAGPAAAETGLQDDGRERSRMVIENTLGYARQLETIV